MLISRWFSRYWYITGHYWYAFFRRLRRHVFSFIDIRAATLVFATPGHVRRTSFRIAAQIAPIRLRHARLPLLMPHYAAITVAADAELLRRCWCQPFRWCFSVSLPPLWFSLPFAFFISVRYFSAGHCFIFLCFAAFLLFFSLHWYYYWYILRSASRFISRFFVFFRFHIFALPDYQRFRDFRRQIRFRLMPPLFAAAADASWCFRFAAIDCCHYWQIITPTFTIDFRHFDCLLRLRRRLIHFLIRFIDAADYAIFFRRRRR